MDRPVVVKFGGSSLANSSQFKKVKDIILKDDRRRYVVVSAPGKTCGEDTKMTDLLYIMKNLNDHNQNYEAVLKNIKDKYNEIISGIGISLDLEVEFEKIIAEMKKGCSVDYIASRGEYLNALILAKYLGMEFLDSKDMIFFDTKGKFDEEITYAIMSNKLKNVERAVIPGFYGATPTGKIKTFTRGGSDLTGSIVARLANAKLYENWTDVSGFMIADPRIIENPEWIEKITYKELRELSYMGACIMHDEAIFPVISKGIPINIKNTNRPDDKGTIIVDDEAVEGDIAKGITGIAGRKNFTVVYIEKVKLNSDLAFFRKLLSILESHNIYLEHMPSSIDSVSLIFRDDEESPKVDEIIQEIKAVCKPDRVGYNNNISLVSVVGRGMRRKSGSAATLFTALSKEKINIRMIIQGSSELNIIVGIEDKDYEKGIKSIYQEFSKDF